MHDGAEGALPLSVRPARASTASAGNGGRRRSRCRRACRRPAWPRHRPWPARTAFRSRYVSWPPPPPRLARGAWVRRRQDHRLNLRIGQHLLERGPDGDFVLGGEVAHRIGLERHAAHKTDRRAEIARRFHQGLAPPAEADDCGVESCGQAGAGAPGCFIGWARAKASFLTCSKSTMRFTVGIRRDIDLEIGRACRLPSKADVGDGDLVALAIASGLFRASEILPPAPSKPPRANGDPISARRFVDLVFVREIFAHPRHDQRMGSRRR